MKELIIHDNEAGQRLDKKNIVLNGKKATGNEHLKKETA